MRKLSKGAVWVCLCLLTLGRNAFATESNEERLGVVRGDEVNVRAKASTDADIVDTLRADTPVTVVGSKGDFYKIELKGKTGYVSDEFISVTSGESGTVNAKSVILRGEPSTDSKKMATLKKDEIVTIYSERNGFYRVTTSEGVGYISTEYVDKASSKKQADSQEKEKPAESIPVQESTEKAAAMTAAAPNEIHLEEEFIMQIQEETDGMDFGIEPEAASYTVTPGSYSQEELDLIAKLVHAETGRSSSEGCGAVASVVYNRMQSSRFPDTVEGVVYQPNQFTVTRNREKFESIEPAQAAKDAVQKVFVEGVVSLPADVLYFKSARLSQSWGSRSYYTTIDSNMYYR